MFHRLQTQQISQLSSQHERFMLQHVISLMLLSQWDQH